MREVKFRAWVKHSRKMVEVSAIQFRNPSRADMPSFIVEINSLMTWTLDEVEIMQYTGIKDKNGVEIYEDDILEIEDATAKVVFWERPPAFGLDFSHNEDKWCEDWNLSDDSKRMEIIGNVHANPELLTK